MRKVDMHIHSTVSDGSFTMEEIVAQAESRGLFGIVITDHDTLSHQKKLPKSKTVQVQAGLEISAYDYKEDYRVHILGYGIKNPEIVEKVVHPTLEARHENSMKQIRTLQAHGIDIDLEKVKRADGKYIYKQHIMDYMVSQGMAEELFGEFYCTKSLARRLAPVTINFPLFKNKNSSFCIFVVLLSYHTKRHTNTANCYDYDNIFFET